MAKLYLTVIESSLASLQPGLELIQPIVAVAL